MRLDQFLVHRKLAGSRTQAQSFIEGGFVYLLKGNDRVKLSKASFTVEETMQDHIVLEENQLQKFVSRAGLKLDHFFKSHDIKTAGKTALDVGQSTGGFTDCLLQYGAEKVIGVDVGHGQLHRSLQQHTQVISYEGLHVKDLATHTGFLKASGQGFFDLVLVDVSFISLLNVIPHLSSFLKSGGDFIFLVKPQFECGQKNLDKNGVVKNTAVFAEIEKNTKELVLKYFGSVNGYVKCSLSGKDGNQEFFIYGKKSI